MWLMATDAQVAEWLRSAPRALEPTEVSRLVAARDAQLGEYVPHGGTVHHGAEESRH